MSDSVRPHRRQPTRLPCPWDSPGKNTGVGCHFLLQCIKVKSESEAAHSYRLLVTPLTAAHQTPHSMGFSRQEYWSGVPSPSPVICPVIFKCLSRNYESLLPFLLCTCPSSRLRSIKGKRGLKQSRTIYGPCPPTMSSAWLLPVENFSQRISLIRGMLKQRRTV